MVGVRCVVDHPALEVLGVQRGPRLAEGCTGDSWGVILRRNEQLGEEALVGEATDLGAAEPVDLIAAAEQGQGAVQGVLDAAEDRLSRSEDLLSLLKFSGDAFLFLAGEVTGDGAVHHASSQTAAFMFKLGDAGPGPGQFGFGPLALLVEFGPQAVANTVLQLLGQGDGLVVPLNGRLNVCGWQVGYPALGAPLLASEAVEVLISALGL